MPRPRPSPLAVGSIRWVHWDSRGLEHDHEVEPKTGLKTLRVEVVEIDGSTVVEQTWTLTQKLPTAGGRDWCAIMPVEAREAGWVMAGRVRDGEGSTRWVRRRALPTRKAGPP